MAHADGDKCSSEWSTKTQNVPAGVVTAVMDYALAFFKGVNKLIVFKTDIICNDKIFSSHCTYRDIFLTKLTLVQIYRW